MRVSAIAAPCAEILAADLRYLAQQVAGADLERSRSRWLKGGQRFAALPCRESSLVTRNAVLILHVCAFSRTAPHRQGESGKLSWRDVRKPEPGDIRDHQAICTEAHRSRGAAVDGTRAVLWSR